MVALESGISQMSQSYRAEDSDRLQITIAVLQVTDTSLIFPCSLNNRPRKQHLMRHEIRLVDLLDELCSLYSYVVCTDLILNWQTHEMTSLSLDKTQIKLWKILQLLDS